MLLIMAEIKRRRSLLETKINLHVIAVEREKIWFKTDDTIKTELDGKSVPFANDTLVIVKQKIGAPIQSDNISCAVQMLPDILQSLSTLKAPEDIVDAIKVLPNILESLSATSLKTADRERKIAEWRDSLDEQRKILHDREVNLDTYKENLEASRQKMQEYADRIKQKNNEFNKHRLKIDTELSSDRAQLNAEIERFRGDRALLQLKLKQAEIEESRRKIQTDTLQHVVDDSESAKMASDRAALVLAMEHVKREEEPLE